ncbi:MAG: hypothetical protein AB7P08_18140 [Burkholderiales bacterium]
MPTTTMPGRPDGGSSAAARPVERLRGLALAILDDGVPASTRRPEVLEMAQILAAAGPGGLARAEDIAAGETLTPDGIAISPTMAAMCAEDFVRTIKFIRGLRAAIAGFHAREPGRPARVLYAGCGPLALLAVPVMAVVPVEEAIFTLLDIHPASIASAAAIMESLGLADRVAKLEAVDAGRYRIDANRPPDVIVVELMRACLEAEPQVAVTRHLLAQAPGAALVPEEVRVELALVDVSREFDLRGAGHAGGEWRRDRVPVAPVFVLNRETVASWEGAREQRLPGPTVRIPDPLERRYQPLLFTVIRTHADHVLKDYESGLTCPRTPSVEGAIAPGAAIRFDYELGARPRLRGIVL